MAKSKILMELGISADTSQAKSRLDQLKQDLRDLSRAAELTPSSKLTPELQKASIAASQLEAHLKAATNVNTKQLNINKLAQELKKSGVTLEHYRNALNAAGEAGEKAFNNLAKEIANANNKISVGSEMLEKFKSTFANTLRWQISSSLLQGFTGAISTAYGYAQDLNESLNNIRIVTGYNTDRMADFAKEANKAAKSLSTTTNEYSKASLIYFQQGLSDKEVKARTDITVKMANVTRQSAEIVSDQMTAVWNNFYDGSKSLEYYADVLTSLGAATASSSEEISQGLEKFAAVAQTVGLSYEYASAALATVTATTRQSADVVGTAFKTLFARLESLSIGETLDDGTSLTKYSQALAAVGINIKDASGGLRDMDSILNDLGKRWQTLSKDQQVALAQTVGGMRQYNQLIALMDNWSDFQDNLITAQTSTGSLQEQSDTYAEGWEAAAKRVQASAEAIYEKLLDDEGFIKLLDFFSEAIDGVSNLIDGLGGLEGVLLSIGSILSRIYGKEMTNMIRNSASAIRVLLPGGRAAGENLRKQALRPNYTGQDAESYTYAQQDANARSKQAMSQFAQTREANKDKTSEFEKVSIDAAEKYLQTQHEIEQSKAKELDIAKQLTQQYQEQREEAVKALGLDGDNLSEKDIDQFFADKEKEFEKRKAELTDSIGDQAAKDLNAWANSEKDRITREAPKTNNKFQNPEEVNAQIADIDRRKEEGLANIKAGAEQRIKESEEYKKLTEEYEKFKKQKIDLGDIRAKEAEFIDDAKEAEKEYNKVKQENIDKEEALRKAMSNTNVDFADRMTGGVQAATSFGSALMGIQGIIDVWNNPDMSGWEKFIAIITSAGMVVSSFGGTLEGLQTLFHVNDNTIKSVTATLGEMTEADEEAAMAKEIQAKATEKMEAAKAIETAATQTATTTTVVNTGATAAQAAVTDKAAKESVEYTAAKAAETGVEITDSGVNVFNAATQNKVAESLEDSADASREYQVEKGKEMTLEAVDGVKDKISQSGSKTNGVKDAFSQIGGKLKSGGKQVGGKVKSGFSNLGKGIKANAGNIGGGLLIAAGIATIAATIKIQDEIQNKNKYLAAAAAKNATKMSANAAEVTDQYNQLKDSIDRIGSAQENLEKLQKGTLEWKEALAATNEQALELINTNKLVEGVDYEVTADGQIKVHEETLQRLKEEKFAEEQLAKGRATAAKKESMQKEAALKKEQLLKDKLKGGAGLQGAGTVGGMAGGFAAGGAAIGAGIGIILPGIGNAVGAAVGAAIGGAAGLIAGGITGAIEATEGFATEAEYEALDKISEALKTQPNLLSDELSDSELIVKLKELGIEDANLAKSLAENREEVQKLIQEEANLSKQMMLMNATLVQQYNTGNELYEKSDYKDFIDIFSAGQMAGTYDSETKEATIAKIREGWEGDNFFINPADWFDDEAQGFFNESNDAFWRDYVKTMYGVDEDYYAREEEGSYRVTDTWGDYATVQKYENGKWVNVTEEDGLSEEAAERELIDKKLAEYTEEDAKKFEAEAQKILDNLSNIGIKAGDELRNLGLELATIVSNGGEGTMDLTKANLDSVQLLLQDSARMGEEYKGIIEASTQAWKDNFTELANSHYGTTQDFLKKTLQKVEENSLDWSISQVQLQSLAAAGAGLQKSFGEGMSAELIDYFEYLSDTFPEKAGEIADLLSTIDWSQGSDKAIAQLQNGLYNLNIVVGENDTAWNNLAKTIQSEVFVTLENLATFLARAKTELIEIYKITDKLELGSIISPEDFKKLQEYGAILSQDYILTAEGYAYIGDASEVRTLNLKLTKSKLDEVQKDTINANNIVTKLGTTDIGSWSSVKNEDLASAANTVFKLGLTDEEFVAAGLSKDAFDQAVNTITDKDSQSALRTFFANIYKIKGDVLTGVYEEEISWVRQLGLSEARNLQELYLLAKEYGATEEEIRKAEKWIKVREKEAQNEFNDMLSERGLAQFISEYEDLAEAVDRAWGTKKLDIMDAQIANLNKQNGYLEEQITYLKEIQSLEDSIAFNEAMQSAGINFTWDQIKWNDNGQISAETMAIIKAAAGGNVSTTILNAIKAVEEHSIKIVEMSQEIKNNIQEATDLALEKIDYKLNIKLEINDLELKLLERQLDRMDDKAYSLADKLSNLGAQTKIYASSASDVASSMAEVLGGTAQSTGDLVNLMQSYSGELTANQKDTLLEYLDVYLNYVDGYSNAVSSMNDAAAEQAREQLEEAIERYKRLAEIIEHIKNITDLTGNNFDITNALIKDINLAASLQALENLKIAVSQFDGDLMSETGKELISSWEETVQTMHDTFVSNVELMAKEFEDKMTGTFGTFERLLEAYDQNQTIRTQYVDEYERVYELNKLSKNIQKEIDKSDNVKVQAILRKEQEYLNKLQASGVELSEHDLEMLQKRYDLRVAEIALEEAQEAKTQMRLTRNAAGNWVYQYTANEEKTAEAEQNFEGALVETQKTSNDYLNNIGKEVETTKQEQSNKLKELYTNNQLSPEERKKAEKEINDYYGMRMDFLEAEFNKTLEFNKQFYAEDWQAWHEKIGYQMQDNQDWQLNFKDTILGTLAEGYNDISSYTDKIKEEANNLTAALQVEWEAFNSNIQSTTDVMTKALGLEEGGLGKVLQDLLGSSSESNTIFGFVSQASKSFQSLAGTIGDVSGSISSMSGSLEQLNKEADTLIQTIITLLKGQESLSYVAVTVDKEGNRQESKTFTSKEDAEQFIKDSGLVGAISAWVDVQRDAKADTEIEIKAYEQALAQATESARANQEELSKSLSETAETVAGNTLAVGSVSDMMGDGEEATKALTEQIDTNVKKSDELVAEAEALSKEAETFKGDITGSNALVIESDTLVIKSNDNLVESNSTLAAAISNAAIKIANAAQSTVNSAAKAATSAANAASSAAEAATSAANAASSVTPQTETTTSSESEKDQTAGTQSETKSSDDKINGYDKKYLANVAWNRDYSLRAKYNGNIAYWYRDYGVPGYDTGGYTGVWGPEGRLAVLHQKELVLNAADTANFLASMEIMRNIVSQIDLQAMAMASSNGLPIFNFGGSPQTLQQEVHIQAEFPNATNHQEIEEAFGNLVNMATQYANRKI